MLDAELSARVLRLVNVMDSGLHRQVFYLLIAKQLQEINIKFC